VRRLLVNLATALTTALAATLLAACQSPSSPMSKLAIPDGTRSSDSTKPARHLDERADWVQARYRAIERDLAGGIALDQVRVLFVGDSITQFYAGEDDASQASTWRAAYTDLTSPNYALNLGVAGDRTESLLYRLLPKSEGGLGHLADPRLQPQIIVLMIGINNTWSPSGDIVGLTVEGQWAVIRRLRALRPGATIVVNSLLPTNQRAHDRDFVEPINRRLAAEAKKAESGVIWLDLYPAFLRADGSGNPALFKDDVHPNAQGYARWSTALLPKLEAVRAARGAVRGSS
jgi:lysophospholipase L1-like esterase